MTSNTEFVINEMALDNIDCYKSFGGWHCEMISLLNVLQRTEDSLKTIVQIKILQEHSGIFQILHISGTIRLYPKTLRDIKITSSCCIYTDKGNQSIQNL